MKKFIKAFCLLFILVFLSPRTSYASSYDREEAARYALEWYNGYNTSKYYDAGLDCTNFVSQCLEAGGFRRTSSVGDWSSLNQWRPHSGTWENADLFSKYWSRFSSRYSYSIGRSSAYSINKSLSDNLRKGDVVQYGYGLDEIKHSQIIHNFGYLWDAEKEYTAFMAQHTDGRAWISLYDYLKNTHYTYVVGLGLPNYINNVRAFDYLEEHYGNSYKDLSNVPKIFKQMSSREEFIVLINTIRALVSDFENDKDMPIEIYNKNIDKHESLKLLLDDFDSLDIENLNDEECVKFYNELRYRFESI